MREMMVLTTWIPRWTIDGTHSNIPHIISLLHAASTRYIGAVLKGVYSVTGMTAEADTTLRMWVVARTGRLVAVVIVVLASLAFAMVGVIPGRPV